MGFLVSLTIYSAFVYRLMTQKLPRESIRPGMFVSVGPSAFTVSGMINMAASAKKAIPADFMGNGPLTAQIIKVVADWAALWLWGLVAGYAGENYMLTTYSLALWFFFVSACANGLAVRHHKLPFAMPWFSFVFPNTALCSATFAIGKAFDNHAIKVVGCVMTCFLILMWIFVMGSMIKAIIKKEIMWPQKGEDRDEGGFKDKHVRDMRPAERNEKSIPV